uniref:PH domain-containing protein n=1 Tax=Cyprinus carpio TaxID=7962 RepID=A0A8C2PRP7_CYPCA
MATCIKHLASQWKEKYLVLTVEGNLMVCRDADSPPDQVVALQSNCESIVEGKEILDLPRLPSGGRRDIHAKLKSCALAIYYPQTKHLSIILISNPNVVTEKAFSAL